MSGWLGCWHQGESAPARASAQDAPEAEQSGAKTRGAGRALASLRRHGGPRPASHVRAGVTAIETQDIQPSHAGGRGRMTEQGMAQGQPGRPPPGHAWRAPRHFVRDAVVFEDYTIAEGRVIPQGAPRTRYHPETCPALPQQLARLARGDTRAVLAFVRTYGLLGYASLAAAVGRGVPSDAAGDPLGWIWAQAETVALCLHLTYGLQVGDDAALQHSLRAVQLPQLPQTDGGPQLIVPAVWDQPRVPISWASPLHSPEDWRMYARAMRREVINAHLLGTLPQLVDHGDRDHPSCHFQALIAMVYWHLLHIAAQGVVQRCAEASCRACFVPTRRTQRFCPAAPPARDSQCAVRARRRAGRQPA